MELIDTHAHIYLEDFDADRTSVVESAIESGVSKILLPNIDVDSIDSLHALCELFPENCLPMMGLHPTSVKEDYRQQLAVLEKLIQTNRYIAIGEIGLDLYWDQSFKQQQIEALQIQFDWAKNAGLPVAIHTREAFDLMFQEVTKAQDGRLRGVFHCFTGDLDEAKKAMDLGFLMGIGGVLTYKKSTLPEVLKQLPLSALILETDAPFLPPVPYRGKRNQPLYLMETLKKLAEVKEISVEEIAAATTANARKLFNLLD